MPCGSTPEVFQFAGADSLAQAMGLTLLEQDKWEYLGNLSQPSARDYS